MTPEDYQTLYAQSLNDPETFWGNAATQLDWITPWQKVLSGSLSEHSVRWFEGGTLNACYNCVDRHLDKHAQQTALIWEGDEPTDYRQLSFAALHEAVCRLANVLKSYQIQKGDRVCIYLPMIPEAIIAMLACARIGAIHSVVFAGFSAQALAQRIQNAQCRLLITADESIRGHKIIPLKKHADTAVATCPSIEKVIVVKRTGANIPWTEKDVCYHDATKKAQATCPIIPMASNDPLFILYTSGSTGKPKGILHGTGGYLTYTCLTFQTIFNPQPNDIYWCTADVGWITGHSYLLYAPLATRTPTVMFEGTPHYPTPARFWQIVDKYHVSLFYTAPTAIRALMREGDAFVQQTHRGSLRLLGTVGEPINPEVWQWYHDVVGQGRCPIVDTWWQTETGGILISPIPGVSPIKPGAACTPFFGILPGIVNEHNQLQSGEATGNLVIQKPWPGLCQTIYNHPKRFAETYFNTVPGCYFTGDGARTDADGDYWITGRIDDVINVSGHRIGSAEVESALVEHADIAEAAVIGIPDPIKGEQIIAFVTPKAHATPSEALAEALIQHTREAIGPFAAPKRIQFAASLPKTRSGKIMRRILRKIASGETHDFGDVSTLADPDVMRDLLQNI